MDDKRYACLQSCAKWIEGWRRRRTRESHVLIRHPSSVWMCVRVLGMISILLSRFTRIYVMYVTSLTSYLPMFTVMRRQSILFFRLLINGNDQRFDKLEAISVKNIYIYIWMYIDVHMDGIDHLDYIILSLFISFAIVVVCMCTWSVYCCFLVTRGRKTTTTTRFDSTDNVIFLF